MPDVLLQSVLIGGGYATGPLWPVMDILTVLIAIMLIAVMSAATGSIFEQAGMPNFLGSVVIVGICGLLNFKGSKVIEKFESISTILLYVGYITFTIIVLVRHGSNTMVGNDSGCKWMSCEMQMAGCIYCLLC